VRAFAFIRWSGAPFINTSFGHVAWAFEEATGAFVCGSFENVGGGPYVRSSQAENEGAYWMARVGGLAAMLNEMRFIPFANQKLRPQLNAAKIDKLPGYYAYKMFNVVAKRGGRVLGFIPWEEDINPNPVGALAEAQRWGAAYTLVSQNCLDNTYKILNTYGAREKAKALMMPTLTKPSTSWTPAGWFRLLDVDGGSQRL
jgi:hypothetical protein